MRHWTLVPLPAGRAEQRLTWSRDGASEPRVRALSKFHKLIIVGSDASTRLSLTRNQRISWQPHADGEDHTAMSFGKEPT